MRSINIFTPAILLTALAFPIPAIAQNGQANVWVRQDQAKIGPETPIAVVWSPKVARFMSLGWISNMYDRRAPYTYDELAYDPASGQWENWFPEGKEWGPKFGVCTPPGWKGRGRFKDAEGNVRPNWPEYYWLIGAAGNCTYLPEQGAFLFYVSGSTFSYDPVKREWKDLAPTGDPQNSTKLKSQLFWGSICYDPANDQVVLFGGGNSDTERGEPGTWIYTPKTNTWRELKLDRQPPQRANARMVYDPASKKIILFGGDQLDQTIADTWTFDGKQWEQKRPALSPSPRAGHAMLWLPKAKKVLLLGGYSVNSTTEYSSHPYKSLPLEAWLYDEKADAWQLVRRFEPIKTNPISPRTRILHAAVDTDDQVAIVDGERKLWLCKIDASKADDEGTTKHGVKPGAVERRTGPYDPAWYKDVPDANPEQVKADLEKISANHWTLRPTPKRPAPNMDWGSAVFDSANDQILRFSGGHSAYSGTAPQVYDIKTDRYSIPFAPEFPIDWCFSNDQVPGEWSFKGNPWMTGHTYKSTGYDPTLKCMVFAPHNYTYFFDPKAGKWTRNTAISPFRPSFYTVNLTTTSRGLTAWAYARNGSVGLWRLNPEDKTWEAMPVKGKLFGPLVDNSGFAFDSRRGRLVFFVRDDKAGCKMAEYSLESGEVNALTATGSEKLKANFREAIYLAKDDMVMIGATGLFYDCAKNAWLKADIPSDRPPITKEGSYNIGVMYDPNRNMVWAVNTNSQVFGLKLDMSALKLEALR
ncbi:MAG: kelch repeat-containing protein [Gemmataceae bacterium]